MKHTFRLFSLLLALMLALSAAAEVTSFDGAVQSAGSTAVTAPIGGTAGAVGFIAGQRIAAGDEIVTLKPTAVYADQDGTVTGIFAAPGDDLSSIVSRYGAVMYLEPDAGFTVSASTDKAYDQAENKFVHIGETVYLNGANNAAHTGTGRITAVNGASFTVEMSDASAFTIGESVRVFRSADFSARSRLGQGTLARVNPAACTASGSLCQLYVQDGDHVKAGDKLFDVLTGSFDGLYFTGSTVKSTVSGIVESVAVNEGASVNKGDTVLRVATDDSLYIAFSVPEADLGYVSVGNNVEIEFLWNEGETELVPGVITFISFVSSSNSGEATYEARASFAPTADTRLGMTAVIYTLAEDEPAEEEMVEGPAAEEEPAEAPVEEAPAEQHARPEVPEGWTPPANGEAPANMPSRGSKNPNS